MRCESCGAVRSNSSESLHSANSSPSTTTISSIELQSLLRSPNPPSTSQISGILASLDNDVSQYDARFRQLRSKIAALENERSWVKAQREKYKSLLAPVRRLPTELLDHVFRIYGDISPNHIGRPGPRKKDVFLPGLVLMSVCTRWRDVAQSCTALGSNISLDMSDLMDEDRLEVLVMPLHWCLDQAGPTAPLDIAFSGSMYTAREPKVVGMLASCASRWRHVSFASRRGLRAFPSLDAISRQDLPLLESLHLFKRGNGRDGRAFVVLGNAPKLREFGCNVDLPDDWKTLYSGFPWTNIRNLELRYRSARQLHLLSQCSNVQSLSYIFPHSSTSSDPQVPPQQSQNVLSLGIKIEEAYSQPDMLRALLNAAKFPALEHMDIRFPMRYSVKFIELYGVKFTWPETAFTSFLLRSKCSLTSLLIEDAIVSDNDLVSLLSHTPGLTAFSFHQHFRRTSEAFAPGKLKPKQETLLTMAYIRRLHAFRERRAASPSNDDALIPKLKTLSLRVLGDWFNDDELFVDVVRSRWIPNQGLATKVGVECLKSVELKVLGREPCPELYESLSQLGLKVEVSREMVP